MQVQGAAVAQAAKGGAETMVVNRNPFAAARVMLATEGVAAFYTGLGAVLAAAAPAQVESSAWPFLAPAV